MLFRLGISIQYSYLGIMVYTRVAGIKKGAKLPAFPQFMQGACYQLTTNNFRTILNWSRCAVKMNDTYITQLISMAEGSVSQSPALKSCHSMRVWEFDWSLTGYLLDKHSEANDPSVEGGLEICSRLDFRWSYFKVMVTYRIGSQTHKLNKYIFMQ